MSKNAISKRVKVPARHSCASVVSGYTGAEAAHAILSQAGITNAEIVEHEELLGNHATNGF